MIFSIKQKYHSVANWTETGFIISRAFQMCCSHKNLMCCFSGVTVMYIMRILVTFIYTYFNYIFYGYIKYIYIYISLIIYFMEI